MENTFSLDELTKTLTAIPFNQMLGLTLDTIEDDHIVMSFVMKKDLIGNFFHGILHGGVISSVLDMAGGVAAIATAVRKHHGKSIDELKEILSKTSTVNLNINFLRPGKGKQFTAKSSVIRSGNKLSFTHMDLQNEEGHLIATGSATYLIG